MSSINCFLIEPRGYCLGVKRILKMAEDATKLHSKLFVTEDIVHNKTLMENMKKIGVVKVSSIEDVPDGSAFMISAHGMSPKNMTKTNGLTTFDGTCPIVKSVQNMIFQASTEGKKIVLIGDKNHQEIIGYLGYAKNSDIFVVYDEKDVSLLPFLENQKVVCFSQTTLNQSTLHKISNILRQKIPHIEFSCCQTNLNICNATKERQTAVQKIANKIDIFIVVGSNTSFNAKMLAKVASEHGAKKILLVENKNELNLEIFKSDISNIAITAGASVPEFLVEDIAKFLQANIPNISIETAQLS